MSIDDKLQDAVIIGAGVVGLATAVELATTHYNDFVNVLVLEKGRAGEEQSTRNSGVIHSGIYFPKESLRAELCVEGNALMYEFCRQNIVPFRKVGKFIVATTSGEESVLEELYARAGDLKIPVTQVLQKEIMEKEPNVHALSGLYFPNTGVVDAGRLIKTLEKKFVRGLGGYFLPQSKVTSIEPHDDGTIAVGYEHGGEYKTATTRVLINSAGLFSDEVASLYNPQLSRRVLPSRGEYCTFKRNKRHDLRYNGTNVYPVPEIDYRHGIEAIYGGVHITPQVTDRLLNGRWGLSSEVLVGPIRQEVQSKTDYESNRIPAEEFIRRVHAFFPSLQVSDLQLGFTGIMTEIEKCDFCIEQDPQYKNIIHLSGMASPALTASFAIAKKVAHMVKGAV